MDDEDLGANEAGLNITTRDNLSSFDPQNQKKSQFMKFMGADTPQDFFVLNRNSIGHKIFENLRRERRKGVDIKKEVENKMEQEESDHKNDDYLTLPKVKSSKQDYKGLGYLNSSEDFKCNLFTFFIKEHLLTGQISQKKIDSKLNSKGLQEI